MFAPTPQDHCRSGPAPNASPIRPSTKRARRSISSNFRSLRRDANHHDLLPTGEEGLMKDRSDASFGLGVFRDFLRAPIRAARVGLDEVTPGKESISPIAQPSPFSESGRALSACGGMFEPPNHHRHHSRNYRRPILHIGLYWKLSSMKPRIVSAHGQYKGWLRHLRRCRARDAMLSGCDKSIYRYFLHRSALHRRRWFMAAEDAQIVIHAGGLRRSDLERRPLGEHHKQGSWLWSV